MWTVQILYIKLRKYLYRYSKVRQRICCMVLFILVLLRERDCLLRKMNEATDLRKVMSLLLTTSSQAWVPTALFGRGKVTLTGITCLFQASFSFDISLLHSREALYIESLVSLLLLLLLTSYIICTMNETVKSTATGKTNLILDCRY